MIDLFYMSSRARMIPIMNDSSRAEIRKVRGVLNKG